MTADNNIQEKFAAENLQDADLEQVTGGYRLYHDRGTDKYYKWTGENFGDNKYLCPNCKRPVHLGWWLKFYCDPCNASWMDESRLLPNYSSGLWNEITKDEFDRRNHPSRYRK